MKSYLLKCSNCGSPLNISKAVKKCKCDYCGSFTVFDNEIADNVLDIHKLINKTEELEGEGFYDKAIELYDDFLQTEPNNPYALFGRALAALSDTNDEFLNMELFKVYFDKGLKELENDKMNILNFLMYRFRGFVTPFVWLWTNRDYNNLYNVDKRLACSQWLKNFMLLHEVQLIINELVDNSKFDNLSKSYMAEYKDFKISIVKFCKDLLSYRFTYGLKLKIGDRFKIRKIIKITKSQYKKFRKIHNC